MHKELLCISYLEHKNIDWVQSKINFIVGLQEPLFATVKKWKLVWFGHVTRHDSLSKTIIHGTLEGGPTPSSAEEMLDGQHQRVDIPARARTAHKDHLPKRLEEHLC